MLAWGVPAHANGIDADAAFAAGDCATARVEYAKAAESGDPSAMAALGTIYDLGCGVRQDFAMALSWYRRAAEARDVRGMFNTAAMYDNGRGTAQDRAEAIRWYSKAAERGDGRAAYDMGVIYRDGDGVRRDKAEAVRYFRMASSAGIAAAGPNLVALGDRSVVSKPKQSAISFDASVDVRKTLEMAEKGDARSQYEAGIAYDRGTSVKPDLVKSYVNFLKASTSGDLAIKDAAIEKLRDVGKRLTDAQHAQARDILLGGS